LDFFSEYELLCFAKGIVAILAGIFMVIMGLNMLNVFPWLRKFNLRMPKIFARKINDEKSRGSNSPLYIGLLNGLMPCGPLQAMQLYALSTGSPIKGALSMLLFSLGTVPLMFGLGALSSLLSKKFTSRMMQVSSVLVIVLGIFMFQNGVNVSGINFLSMPSISGKSSSTSFATATITDGVQNITSTISRGSYQPITIQAGIPVKWTIKAAEGTINGCNGKIIIPAYNIEKQLKVGDNVIEFTPDKTGTIPFSCWMGMIRSKINIVDDINSSEQDTIQSEVPQEDIPAMGCCG
jgi:sulfite exporter TauE/SafE